MITDGADPTLKNNKGETPLDYVPRLVELSNKMYKRVLDATKERIEHDAKLFGQATDFNLIGDIKTLWSFFTNATPLLYYTTISPKRQSSYHKFVELVVEETDASKFSCKKRKLIIFYRSNISLQHLQLYTKTMNVLLSM